MTLSRSEILDLVFIVPRLTDFSKISLKLSGVLTLELQDDAQDVVAPDHVELLLELEESSELSEQLWIINRNTSARIKGIKNFKFDFFKRFSTKYFIN